MPPGIWHAVYTATTSYFTGGHFYTLETLHLTEFSRAFDHTNAEVATNADHDVDGILYRMALALPKFEASRRM